MRLTKKCIHSGNKMLTSIVQRKNVRIYEPTPPSLEAEKAYAIWRPRR